MIYAEVHTPDPGKVLILKNGTTVLYLPDGKFGGDVKAFFDSPDALQRWLDRACDTLTMAMVERDAEREEEPTT